MNTKTNCTSLAIINPDLNASISNLFQNYLTDQIGERYFNQLMQNRTNHLNQILIERENIIRKIVNQRRATGRFRNPLSILASVFHFNAVKKVKYRSDQESGQESESLDLTSKEIIDGAIESAFA